MIPRTRSSACPTTAAATRYKTDAGSQAMHAAHSFIACWDDHESANNPWTGGAQTRSLDRAFAEHCPEIDWTDNMHSGYVRLELGRETALATFVAIDNISDRDFCAFILNRVTITRQDRSVAFVMPV